MNKAYRGKTTILPYPAPADWVCKQRNSKDSIYLLAEIIRLMLNRRQLKEAVVSLKKEQWSASNVIGQVINHRSKPTSLVATLVARKSALTDPILARFLVWFLGKR